MSSTCKDLPEYREPVRNAIDEEGCRAVMMERWAARGDNPPMEICLAEVRNSNVLVVVVADRYGWVPPGDQNPEGKSITWLECEAAAGRIEILPFVLDDNFSWDRTRLESYRLEEAARLGHLTLELTSEVTRNVSKLAEFKAWLDRVGTAKRFTTPDDLGRKVAKAIREWRNRRSAASLAVVNESNYRQRLQAEVAWLPLFTDPSQAGERVPLGSLYVPLRCADAQPSSSTGARKRRFHLEAALERRLLVVLGGAGSGKTTFLRYIVLTLLAGRASEHEPALSSLIETEPLPFLLRAADFASYLRSRTDVQDPTMPATADSPAWLAHYLNALGRDRHWELPGDYIDSRMRNGSCVVLVDALDEVTSRPARERIAAILSAVAVDCARCRLVLTSRPDAFPAAMLPGFAAVSIARLGSREIHAFLARWTERSYGSDLRLAHDYLESLNQALHTGEARQLAWSPILLTALATVHRKEQRLPRRRVKLYQFLIDWILRSRELVGARVSAERAFALLRRLALAMQDHASGRLTRVHYLDAAKIIAPKFTLPALGDAMELAHEFIDDQVAHNAILISERPLIGFSHLSFQEFLAASAISDLPDEDQKKILFARPERLYDPQWLETIRFLVGILAENAEVRLEQALGCVVAEVLGKESPDGVLLCSALLNSIEEELADESYRVQSAGIDTLLCRTEEALETAAFHTVDEPVRIRAAEFCAHHVTKPSRWIGQMGGWFWMGSQAEDAAKRAYDPDALPTEAPPHRAWVASFRLSETPVTVSQWTAFIGAGGYHNQGFWTAGGFGLWSEPALWEEQLAHPRHPATGVSWYEAMAWCAWAGCRLPTEAEWEFAAAGPKRRRYPWGNEDPNPQHANFGRRCGGLVPVGLYRDGATPEGVLDLAGNAWEWVLDRFAVYSPEEVRNPTGPAAGEDRVLRGGAWLNSPRFLRSTDRVRSGPAKRYSAFGPVGFRCVALP